MKKYIKLLFVTLISIICITAISLSYQSYQNMQLGGENDGLLHDSKFYKELQREQKEKTFWGKVEKAFGICDHDWKDATCEKPKTCSFCGKTDGTTLYHDFQPIPTCQTQGICTLCGEKKSEIMNI